MSLETAIGKLVTMLDTLSGLHVYADPPENINQFPAAIVHAKTGEMSLVSAGFSRNQHTLIVDIYHARQVLPQAIDEAKRWPEEVFALLANDRTLNGSVSTVVWPLRYVAGVLRYGGQHVHYGVRFEVTVVMLSNPGDVELIPEYGWRGFLGGPVTYYENHDELQPSGIWAVDFSAL